MLRNTLLFSFGVLLKANELAGQIFNFSSTGDFSNSSTSIGNTTFSTGSTNTTENFTRSSTGPNQPIIHSSLPDGFAIGFAGCLIALGIALAIQDCRRNRGRIQLNCFKKSPADRLDSDLNSNSAPEEVKGTGVGLESSAVEERKESAIVITKHIVALPPKSSLPKQTFADCFWRFFGCSKNKKQSLSSSIRSSKDYGSGGGLESVDISYVGRKQQNG